MSPSAIADSSPDPDPYPSLALFFPLHLLSKPLLPFLLLTALYLLCSPFFKDKKKKSYILSAGTALVMSLSGLWWAGRWWKYGLVGVLWSESTSASVGLAAAAVSAGLAPETTLIGIRRIDVSTYAADLFNLFDFLGTDTQPLAFEPDLPSLARLGTRFFRAYLILDLGIGYVAYRDQIGFLTGWVHHV